MRTRHDQASIVSKAHCLTNFTHSFLRNLTRLITAISNDGAQQTWIIQIFLGVALLSLSTHLALESARYLDALNQSGLNQYHAFGVLVCLSFISGIFLIAQHVLTQDEASIDEHFNKALTY
jgi:hypothetical protein